ncbi:hypothetical protein KLNKPBOH_02746 [Aeromonas veronii]
MKETIPQQCLSFLRASPYRRMIGRVSGGSACFRVALGSARSVHTYRGQ